MKAKIKVEDDVRAVLDRSTVEGNLLRLPREQLDRKLYQRVDKVLGALGGAWDRKLRAHVFEGDPAAAIGRAKDEGAVPHPNQLDFFRTDCILAPLVAGKVLRGEPYTWKRTLEPSAGDGALVDALCGLLGPPTNDGDLSMVEVDPGRYESLRRFDEYRGSKRLMADFLSVSPPAKLFDRVLMNPPFERGSDARHIAHALGFLAPGGRLVSVASAGLKSRSDKVTKALRERVLDCGGVIADLPEGSFESAGTKVSTVLVTYDAEPARIPSAHGMSCCAASAVGTTTRSPTVGPTVNAG